MWDLQILKKLNDEAVAEHAPSLLDEEWLEGEAQLAGGGAAGPPSDDPPRKSKRTIFLTVEATLQGAEVLGYDLSKTRRAIAMLLRDERGLPPDAPVEVGDMALYAFILTVAPQIVSEVTDFLRTRLRRYEEGWPSSFTLELRDRGGARILVRRSRAIAVIRPPRHKTK